MGRWGLNSRFRAVASAVRVIWFRYLTLAARGRRFSLRHGYAPTQTVSITSKFAMATSLSMSQSATHRYTHTGQIASVEHKYVTNYRAPMLYTTWDEGDHHSSVEYARSVLAGDRLTCLGSWSLAWNCRIYIGAVANAGD